MNKRVLVITRNAWNNGNSTGNTASNFFSNWDKNSIANLFCRAELPNNQICDKYYRITENELIGSILKKKDVGHIASYNKLVKNECQNNIKTIAKEKKLYDFFRNYRIYILVWAREILWSIGKWKNDKLYSFLKDFNPQIIYMPIHDCFYMHNILHYAKSVTNAKIILFTGDDMYSLKQFSLSGLYWINRFILRSKIRRSIKMADICYCMSDIQISEFKKEFDDKFKILRKGMSIKNLMPVYPKHAGAINFVYTGNICNGRWKVIAKIGKAIHELNNEKNKVKLYIYSANKLTSKMKKKLNIGDEVRFMGSVLPNRIPEIQQNADVVIHVESFELKYKLQTRLSFSTKLVDYFQNGKCIFAVGWSKANSIDYLIENDAAIIAVNEKEIKEKIKSIIDNPNIIDKYALKSWECGKLNHHKEDLQKLLYEDFNNIIKTSSD